MSIEVLATAPRRVANMPRTRSQIRGPAATLLAGILIAAYAWHHWPAHQYAAALSMIDAGADEPVHYAALSFRDATLEPERSILHAYLSQRSGQQKRAIQELKAARRNPNSRWRALVISGTAWSELGHLPEAVAAWEGALKEKDVADLRRRLAVAYFNLGAVGPTHHHLERLMELSPSDPRPHWMMAKIHRDFEREEEAAKHYEIALRLIDENPALARYLPELSQVRLERAACLAHVGKYEEALEALSGCDATASALSVRAECYFAQGQFDKAKAAAQAALEQESTYLPALLLRADVAMEEGRAEEALDFALRAAAAAPTDPRSRRRLGQVYQRLGMASESTAELAKMEDLNKLRQWFTELHQRASERPFDADLRYQLGQVAEQLGWNNLAADWYTSALKINPNHPHARPALEALNARRQEGGS